MRVFLSLPMSGRDLDDVVKELGLMRNKFCEKFCSNIDINKIRFIDNLQGVTSNEDAETLGFLKKKDLITNEKLYYLGNAIKRMATCDYIIFSKYYESAKGCKIEEDIAHTYGLQCFYMVESDGEDKCLHEEDYAWKKACETVTKDFFIKNKVDVEKKQIEFISETPKDFKEEDER